VGACNTSWARFGGAAKMEAPATKIKAANRTEFCTRKRIAEMTKRAVVKKAAAVD
jgi:hypothetical protein